MRLPAPGSSGWLVLALALAGPACIADVQVQRFAGIQRPSKPPGCALTLVRWRPPDGSLTPVARIDLRDTGGALAIDRLSAERKIVDAACAVGADGVLFDREEYARPYVGTDVAATAFVYVRAAPFTPPMPPWPPAPPLAPVPDPAGAGCAPPCSPGYGCVRDACVALCNPSCVAGMTCGPDRMCRPAAGPR